MAAARAIQIRRRAWHGNVRGIPCRCRCNLISKLDQQDREMVVMKESTRLLFFGGGNMGSALIRGVRQALPNLKLILVDPDVGRVEDAVRGLQGVSILPDAPSSSSGYDLLVLAVKPQNVATFSDGHRRLLAESPVLSVMAGMPLGRLMEVCGSARVARVMPNLPAFVGQGTSLGVTGQTFPISAKTAVEQVFAPVGKFEWVVDAALIDKAMPFYACAPRYIFAFAEQRRKRLARLDFDTEFAQLLVAQTMLGSAAMLAADPRSPSELKRAVISPGGTTEAGVIEMEREGALPKIVRAATSAAYRRSVELRKS
ncbi:hypothetical protein XH83_36575 (plasmid) [Bradyrhizobium sp. CCBAU 53351]|uniref:Pyrroline-5-carboxylate reductase n=4 Tax=Bradyrhizobium TaxID=374 RepID=A0AAE5X968_9BRAD|nr:hypothetical protein X265_39435 [Bradyrhizobium guangdongense]QAU51165.1 hypothetical protein XH91_38635 [Bradyrhizobium guangzhouense]QOZ49249.1 hypothetical protein XH89_37625 [Bradyrhizobium sp. CCBAU 53340]QOZ57055.1 hypothetical protein XH90_38065 [Bradyrhizobium sp. CCBAU 53338]QOZ81010.1 hypothetical protein XH83_36575 [Bradyrhizobium sp. CCBAU 53351]